MDTTAGSNPGSSPHIPSRAGSNHPSPGPQASPLIPNRAGRIVLGSLGGVLLLVVAGVVLLVNVVGATTNQAKDLADDFTRLMVSGEAGNAYDNYLDASFQEEVAKEDFIAGHQELELDASCKPTYGGTDSYKEDGIKFAEVWGVLACDGKNLEFDYFFEGKDELKLTNVWFEPVE